jgi:hypothetical protein
VEVAHRAGKTVLPGLLLDEEELLHVGDQAVDEGGGLVAGEVEAATGMGTAAGAVSALGGGDGVVAAVAIDQQRALRADKEILRDLAAAARIMDEGDGLGIDEGPGLEDTTSPCASRRARG